MDPELKALIESREFGQYHKKSQSRTFSPFDVLQVADVEIRHSNVLAWLLTPNETHGIGGRFLRDLVEHLTRRHDDPSLRPLKPLPHGFDGEDNVEIRREDDHDRLRADITIGFKAQGVLLIIENKLGASYPDAEEQIELYQKVFGKKYESQYDKIPGVLLTASTSPEERDAERGFMHLGWKDVDEVIRSLLQDRKNFADGHVRDFVERYLDVIGKLTHVGDDLAEQLRKGHPRILAKLQEENRRGERAVLDKVDEPYRATVQQWVEYFEERPAKLREEVAERLTQRGGAGIKRLGGRGGYKNSGWLHWWETPPSGEDLGVGDCLWWWFTFEPRSVTVELGTPWESNPKNPNMQKIWEFMQHTPIDLDTKRFPRGEMKHRIIYRHNLLSDDELSGPFEESVKLLHRRLDEFFGSDGDYERIERYFRCLAFDPRGPREPADSGGADLPAPAAS